MVAGKDICLCQSSYSLGAGVVGAECSNWYCQNINLTQGASIEAVIAASLRNVIHIGIGQVEIESSVVDVFNCSLEIRDDLVQQAERRHSLSPLSVSLFLCLCLFVS